MSTAAARYAARRHRGSTGSPARGSASPISTPTRLGVPKIFDLIADPKEEYGATLTPNGWAVGPMMNIVAEFERSVQTYPLIPPGAPDPYRPPPARR